MITENKITHVEAKRLTDAAKIAIEGLDVNIAVNEVKVEANGVRVKYTYGVNYRPNLATLTISGDMLSEQPKDKIKDIDAEYKKTKQLPPFFAEEVINAIQYTGSATGTLLAFAVNITAPLNMPRARVAPENAQQGKTAA